MADLSLSAARAPAWIAASTRTAALVSIMLGGAIFGFFYAWVCSTMWGLDAAPPLVAIEAMQAMNASVRNIVFAPAFFGTGPVYLAVAALALRDGARRPATLFALAGALYLVGAFALTLTVNVPMNLALADVALPLPEAEAQAIWAEYSARWQVFNILRTVVSGAALALAALGLHGLGRAG